MIKSARREGEKEGVKVKVRSLAATATAIALLGAAAPAAHAQPRNYYRSVCLPSTTAVAGITRWWACVDVTFGRTAPNGKETDIVSVSGDFGDYEQSFFGRWVVTWPGEQKTSSYMHFTGKSVSYFPVIRWYHTPVYQINKQLPAGAKLCAQLEGLQLGYIWQPLRTECITIPSQGSL
jgi:hypothetical protein